MTYEEAISILTKDRALCLFNPLTGDVGPLNEDCRMSAEAMNLAIEALEKRIPKKPIERFMLSYDIDAGVCPLCNVGVHEEMNFCSYCGQAIDWEDDE